ncbi:hypothetical protein [uncultured Corynebacterium sp.]|uniref:hypothetical protein n=1 Tax=uncultured Corynebacterium sp. TaxID=159447 RepID=UPI0028D8F975|nr:hypothetical protein [uncultured Corynebacterium sp.]
MNIAAIGQGRPKKTTPLNAMEFIGPTGNVVVKLVPNALVKAETIAMKTAGLSPTRKQKVGYVPPASTGFPVAALAADPQGAQYVLDLIPTMEWARRVADTDASAVRTRFDALNDALFEAAPRVIPPIFDELARIFARVEKNTYAKHYYAKARQVERDYDLPIDASQRAATFVEFFNLGVAGVRELRDQVRTDLQSSAQVMIAVMRAGVGAYAGVLQDIPEDKHQYFLEAVLGLSGFRRSEAGFFQEAHELLVMLASKEPDYREVLRKSRPVHLTAVEFLSLLHDCDAIPTLAVDLVDWLHSLGCGEALPPDRRLVDAVRSVSLSGLSLAPRFSIFPIELVDALCASGIEWDGDFGEELRWQEWASDSDWCDLAGIYSHKRLRSWLAANLNIRTIANNFDAFAASKPARRLASLALTRLVKAKQRFAGSGPEWEVFQTQQLAYVFDKRLASINSKAMAQLRSFDPVAELQLRISRGVMSELAWPMLEQVCRSHKSFELYDAYPAVAVRSGQSIEMVDGDAIVARGRLPKDCRTLDSAWLVGERIAVRYDDAQGTRHCRLLGARTRNDSELLAPWGSQECNGKVVGTGPHYVLGDDAATVWETGEIVDMEYFSPLKRGTSVPGIKITGLRRTRIPADHEFLMSDSLVVSAYPTTEDGPCGVSNGAHIALSFGPRGGIGDYRLVTPLGSFRAPVPLCAALNRPGGGTWLLSRDRMLIDADSGLPIAQVSDGIGAVPVGALSQLRPRDLNMSIALRAVTTEQAEELWENPELATIEKLFGSNSVIAESLLSLVSQVRRLHSWFSMADYSETNDMSEAALSLLFTVTGRTGRGSRSVNPYHEATKLWEVLSSLDSDPTPATTMTFRWLDYIGREKTLVAGLAGRHLDPDVVAEVCRFLLWATELGIFGSGWQSRDAHAGHYDGDQHWRYNRNRVLVYQPDSADSHLPDLSLTRSEFVYYLGVILAWSRRQDWPDQSVQLAARTILTPETCAYMLGGLVVSPGEGVPAAAVRNRYGLSQPDMHVAILQLRGLTRIDYVLGAGVGADFPETGLDIAAMAAQLNANTGKPIMHITAAQFQQAIPQFDDLSWLTNVALSQTTEVPVGLDEYSAGDYLATLLHLIGNTSLDDPARGVFREKLQNLKTYGQQQLDAGEWEVGTIDIVGAADYRKLDYFTRNTMPIRVLLEGHLDGLLMDLGRTGGPAGDPHDPLVAVPEIVAEVANRFSVSTDSARYFLQVLALADPTDAHVRAWNGWRKSQLDKAAAPLVAQGLLVLGEHLGAGRGRFLPGAWQDGVEASKAVRYLVCAGMGPILTKCPPLWSLDRLFAAAWRDYTK